MARVFLVWVISPGRSLAMRNTLGRRRFRRRIIALAAAYAIALASLIASFGTARAAAEAASQPDAVLCHGGAAERSAPASDGSNGKICIDACCIGCLTMAATVPAPVAPAAVPHSLSQPFVPLARFILIGGTDFNAHRSRGPPPAW